MKNQRVLTVRQVYDAMVRSQEFFRKHPEVEAYIAPKRRKFFFGLFSRTETPRVYWLDLIIEGLVTLEEVDQFRNDYLLVQYAITQGIVRPPS